MSEVDTAPPITAADDVVVDAPVKTTKHQNTVSTVASSLSDEPEAEDLDLSDEELLVEGERLCNDDLLLPGLRIFRRVKDSSLFTDEQTEWIRRAELMEKLREDLMAPSSEGWTKQGESHGDRDFVTYYKIEDGGKLKCRIESVIEASLYVPFLAVMNETDLYETWFPKWRFPFKLGINRSNKLKQRGRVEQVVQLQVDLPWPIHNREIVFWGFAEEDADLNRDVGAKLVTVGDDFDNGLVPPPEKGIVRMDFEMDFLFRPCPPDHVALSKSTAHYPEGENLILLTTVMYCDPKIAFVPHSFMNFCTRTAIGTVWRMILKVSEEVREGKRPAHADLIASKREELYDWIEERAQLITGMHPSQRSHESSTPSTTAEDKPDASDPAITAKA
jgi:hypothetical protein